MTAKNVHRIIERVLNQIRNKQFCSTNVVDTLL